MMAYNPLTNKISGFGPGYDRISELPDSLLSHILSYLPTKDSVNTSALSKRWKNLWLSVPVLDLKCNDFPYEAVLSFFDRLLEFQPHLRLLKVKVECRGLEMDGLKDRIRTLIKRGPQHLDILSSFEHLDPDTQIYESYVEFMPLNLYTSRTLVSLTLKFSGVEDPGFVCMPCLKSMTLIEVHFRDNGVLEKLVSGCPVLEELTLLRDMISTFVGEVNIFMRVRSGSLKRFCVPFRIVNLYNTPVKCTLEIDAPRLEHMTLAEDQFDIIMVKNTDSLVMVDLDIKFGVHIHEFFFVPEDSSERKNFGEFFLYGISSVRHMIISKKTVKALELYSEVGLIPKFNNLSRLQAVFPSKLLQFLPAFLECCPNLKHLILEVVYSREDSFELTNVPKCFLSTLEYVELKRIHDWEEEEMKVATYFLENAAVLKKLTLSLTDYPRPVSDEQIIKKVNKVTKLSPSCQIFHDWDPFLIYSRCS